MKISVVFPLALGLLTIATPRPAQAAALKSIAYLCKLEGPNRAVDDAAIAHITSLDYSVHTLGEATRPEEVKEDMVVLSSTVSGKNVSPAWRFAPKPLLTWENDSLDDLAMTGKRHDVDFGETEKERYLWLVNAPHPMSGGLPPGIANVYAKQNPMSWGKPGLGATIIATVYGQPEKAAIFGYEKGATMNYESLAPARRTMVFLDNATFTALSPQGLCLFDSALLWTGYRTEQAASCVISQNSGARHP
ncbi:hypothetical protein HW511_01785 [Asaia siamensis]|uniref:Lipoprotein transmembrane n=1 Tax=Asaia siamensis TaxID=110479 RepID=A0ABQ1L7X7_9PROT|nr:hypothetical protein [Asaia siamensis]GBR09727.1 hypothetical protein AA0323_2568 [Asaia siamensis NRIC 0323]GGC19268.1 hypothetical protein GCM10007207_00590 [Asaia siamensis]